MSPRETTMRTLKIACALGATLAAVAFAAPAPAQTAAAPETIVLKAAHIFDATGTALKDGGLVVVQGERIVSVGVSAPPGARVIDLGDATLLPGFIDAHTHITMQLEKNYYLGRYHDIMRFPAEQVLYG